jgi:hypothetical protein
VSPYALVIHCGACTASRREVLAGSCAAGRRCPDQQLWLVIAYSLGIFERALQPFPAALDAYRQAAGRGGRPAGMAGPGKLLDSVSASPVDHL